MMKSVRRRDGEKNNVAVTHNHSVERPHLVKRKYLRYSGPRVVVAILKALVPAYLAKRYLGLPQLWFRVYSALVVGVAAFYLDAVTRVIPNL